MCGCEEASGGLKLQNPSTKLQGSSKHQCSNGHEKQTGVGGCEWRGGAGAGDFRCMAAGKGAGV